MLIVDVHAPRPFNLSRLVEANVRGIYPKRSEGATVADRAFASRRAAALEAGLYVGSYHYAYPTGGDAVTEARYFVGLMRRALGREGFTRRDLRPALDLEGNPGGLGPRALEKWARDWNRVVWTELGVCGLFYSYPWFIRVVLRGTSVPIACGLWLASYGPNDGRRHPYTVPAPWKKAVMHQYTSKGRLWRGGPLYDLNYAPRLAPLLARPVPTPPPLGQATVA
ncbi:MAG: glycoside hydrolase family 25 protein [Gaiellaceae bacterium]